MGLSASEWAIEHLQAASGEVEASLDWFTTPETSAGKRFEFAREVETAIAILDGNLSCYQNDQLTRGQLSELVDMLSEGARIIAALSLRAESEFASIPLSILLNELSSRYEEASEQFSALLECADRSESKAATPFSVVSL